MNNGETKSFGMKAIIFCLVGGFLLLLVLTVWNVSSQRAFYERQIARGSLQNEMGNKLMELLNAQQITYSKITFDFIPKVPRVLVHYDGLKKAGEARQLHGDIVLNYQSPDFWQVTGAGDLAKINTSLQTGSRGFVW
jgi:hypothetical protein